MTTAAHAIEIKGRARVMDGDTLWLGDIKVRLNGIDAPERGQARFRAASRQLQLDLTQQPQDVLV